MPTFMHQWIYKESLIRALVEKDEAQDRAAVVEKSIKAFGGSMHAFYFSFGQFDGVAISEFDDERAALACQMAIVGQGNIETVHTTTLFGRNDVLQAITATKDVLHGRPMALPPRQP